MHLGIYGGGGGENLAWHKDLAVWHGQAPVVELVARQDKR